MFFGLEADEGRAIRGWIAPDDPAVAARLILVAADRPELTLEANRHRPDIQEMGLHPTGCVGFEIDEALVADLAGLAELSLFDAQSRLLLYRRVRPHHVRKKLFVFDASAMPQNALLRPLALHFANAYPHCERLSLATTLSIVKSRFFQSAALCGRCSFSRYGGALSGAGYLTAALLQDPFVELAERLLTLKLFASGRLAPAAAVVGLEPGLGFAAALRLNDERAMLQAFRALEPEQRDVFVNPMTRLFGCEAGETPHRRHVSVALETLAGVDVVGVRAEFALFRRLLAAALGADALGEEAPVTLDLVSEVAQRLSRIGVVEDMLDGDRQLHECVAGAMRAATDGGFGAVRRDVQSI